MDTETYSRSHFTKRKGIVLKSCSSITGHPPGFPVQMPGERLAFICCSSLYNIYFLISRGKTLLSFSELEFSALHCLLLLLINIICMKITGETNSENVSFENSSKQYNMNLVLLCWNTSFPQRMLSLGQCCFSHWSLQGKLNALHK